MLKCPFYYKKLQTLQLRLNAIIIDIGYLVNLSFIIPFCKTIF